MRLIICELITKAMKSNKLISMLILAISWWCLSVTSDHVERTKDNNQSWYHQPVAAGANGRLKMWISTSHNSSLNQRFSSGLTEQDLLNLSVEPKVSNDIDMDPCKAGKSRQKGGGANWFFSNNVWTFLQDRFWVTLLTRPRSMSEKETVSSSIEEGGKRIRIEKRGLPQPDRRGSGTMPSYPTRLMPTLVAVTSPCSNRLLLMHSKANQVADLSSSSSKAMRHWENFTCIQFVEKTEEHDNWIVFTERPCG